MTNEIISAYIDDKGNLAVSIQYAVDNHQVTWWYTPAEYWPRAARSVMSDDEAAEFDAHPADMLF